VVFRPGSEIAISLKQVAQLPQMKYLLHSLK
jgi:hypothetical protein